MLCLHLINSKKNKVLIFKVLKHVIVVKFYFKETLKKERGNINKNYIVYKQNFFLENKINLNIPSSLLCITEVTGAFLCIKSYCSHSYLWIELSINVSPSQFHSNFRQHTSDVIRARFSLEALQGIVGPMTYWVIRNILPLQLIRSGTRALTGVVMDQFKWRGPAGETVGVQQTCSDFRRRVWHVTAARASPSSRIQRI